MKNRNSMQFTTIIIILSILTVSGEFLLLHLLGKDLYAMLISAAITLIVTLILLGASGHYESVFIYLLLDVLLSGILAGYRFWELQYFYYSVQNLDLWMIIINYTIPILTCMLHQLFCSRAESGTYSRFVRNTSILFLLCYTAIFVYIQFMPHPEAIWSAESTNLIPFYTLAGYIENYLYHDCALKDIFPHLLLPMLLYVPAGFFIALLMRRFHRIFRILLLFFVPCIVEAIQYLFQIDHINIDHVIYAMLGEILGELLLFLVNGLFLLIRGTDFPEADQRASSRLHF